MFYLVTLEDACHWLVMASGALDAIEKAEHEFLIEPELWHHGKIQKVEYVPFIGVSDKITKEGIYREVETK